MSELFFYLQLNDIRVHGILNFWLTAFFLTIGSAVDMKGHKNYDIHYYFALLSWNFST